MIYILSFSSGFACTYIITNFYGKVNMESGFFGSNRFIFLKYSKQKKFPRWTWHPSGAKLICWYIS